MMKNERIERAMRKVRRYIKKTGHMEIEIASAKIPFENSGQFQRDLRKFVCQCAEQAIPAE